ncbi:hypothetical protein JCM8208_000600 [Rhodotorula glutinis]
MNSSVRSWVFTKLPFPQALELVDRPAPEKLEPTQIAVNVVAAALNPVDGQVCALKASKSPDGETLSAPAPLASDFAGTVVAVGDGVDKWKVGDQIMGLTFEMEPKTPFGGSLGTLAVIDINSSCITRKPAALGWNEAAGLPLVGLTAKTTLSEPLLRLPPRAADAQEPPTVVVLGGSSGVGQYCVQLGKAAGLRVVATCSAASEPFVRSLGADEVIDYTAGSVLESLRAVRPDDGFISIVDCVGGTELLDALPSLLTPKSPSTFPHGGSYTTIVGDKTDRSTMGGAFLLDVDRTMRERQDASDAGSLAYRYACILLDMNAEWLDDLAAKAAGGELKVPVDSTFGFERAREAYERLATGRARGKVVVEVQKA